MNRGFIRLFLPASTRSVPPTFPRDPTSATDDLASQRLTVVQRLLYFIAIPFKHIFKAATALLDSLAQ